MKRRQELIQSELLFVRYQRGDRHAIAELVELWQRPLLYYIRRLVASEEDAWDTLQEVWLRALRRLKTVRDPASLPAWLFSVARNTAIGLLRRRQRAQLLLVESVQSIEDIAADPLGSRPSLDGLSAREIHSGLSALSPLQREVLVLRFVQGFTIAEISQITRAPQGTIKSRLHHAKKALRSSLAGATR